MTTNEEIVESLVSESCISLFSDYSLPLQRTEAKTESSDTDLLYCGVVGFTGEQMRGAILLATTREPLGRTSPVNDTSFREWIAELSNQLLGRLKNKLMSRGVLLHMSTPVVLRGQHQHLTPVTANELKPLVFECEGGVVCVWMDAEIVGGVDLNVEQAESGSISEGEGMLF
jgi:CheY-specific phosphatase CheX